MLVISRKKGEKIHIGRDITITIVDIRAGKVRIGIDAPDKLPIQRSTEKEADIDSYSNESVWERGEQG